MLYKLISHIKFEYPQVLWLLALLPLLFYILLRGATKKESYLPVSVSGSRGASWKVIFRWLPLLFRMLACAAIITALARPRSFNDLELVNSEGIDIVLCIDISGSMNATDLTPTRLDAAKEVAASFIRNRKGDQVGLVVFSAEAFTPCPVTTHYEFLLQSIYDVRSGMLKDGTHIGEGLGTAVSGLEKSTAPSRVVILLTDGMNDPNAQDVSPDDAAELAKAMGVKVYTVGVGREGKATVQRTNASGQLVNMYVENNIDEKLLKKIATETGGKYFRATDNEGLQSIYNEIDLMEKRTVETTRFRKYTEYFFPFVWMALGLLLLEIILRYTVFRKFP
jgi:Ca-activated chloride channel homolog